MPPAYWQYLHKYDHIKLANQINQPVLVLQGERDFQVT
jgi:dipeptidyl aminopeptidase/acylaminoacyl peptidase